MALEAGRGGDRGWRAPAAAQLARRAGVLAAAVRQVLWASSSCRSPCRAGALHFPGSGSSLACCIPVQPASPESPPLALPPEPVPCLPASLHAASYLLAAFSLRPLPTLAPRYPFPPLLFIHLSTRSARDPSPHGIENGKNAPTSVRPLGSHHCSLLALYLSNALFSPGFYYCSWIFAYYICAFYQTV